MRRAVIAAAVGVLAAVPLVTGSFFTTLVTRGMTWAILGLSVWFLLRLSNLPSFGHAAFFGVAAYAAGLAVTEWDVSNLFVALGFSLLITCVVAVPIAFVTTRLKGVSFLLVTLALAEMLHALALRWRVGRRVGRPGRGRTSGHLAVAAAPELSDRLLLCRARSHARLGGGPDPCHPFAVRRRSRPGCARASRECRPSATTRCSTG